MGYYLYDYGSCTHHIYVYSYCFPLREGWRPFMLCYNSFFMSSVFVWSETLVAFSCRLFFQPWVTWTVSGCTGSLCASRCPNTPMSSFPVKATRTRAWPKTTATPLCTVSRSPAPKTTPTSSHLQPPCTSPTSRKSFVNTWPVVHIVLIHLKHLTVCFCFSPSVVEDDLKMLFSSSGAMVKAFKFFQ